MESMILCVQTARAYCKSCDACEKKISYGTRLQIQHESKNLSWYEFKFCDTCVSFLNILLNRNDILNLVGCGPDTIDKIKSFTSNNYKIIHAQGLPDENDID